MKNFSIEFKWAMVFTVFSLIWMYVERSLGWHSNSIFNHQIFTNLLIIPLLFIFTITFGLREKKRMYYDGIISWEQALVSGGIISVIICVFTPALQYIFSEVISPEYFEKAAIQLSERGGTSIEKAKDVYNLKASIIDAVVFNLAMGIVTSAIVGAFIKNSAKKN
ncbi:DUF4199 domain-containing protein [Mesonia aquimarina]|uniref:DUF4199 domain-containing protein n=1 Tax=Mesonia aquimarina TaxID=1504967 RepID=UPI000EF5D5F8|nr:DUF4199 domain-containing protein [Mesonia aquimarina]